LGWLNRLWTPWRYQYIKSASKKAERCFLCEAAKDPEKPENLVVYKDEIIIILLNKYPYNNGHLMVAPIRHVKNLEDLSKDESYKIWEGIVISKKILDESYNPHGYNIGINLGKAAGAGLEDHLHIHIVPRWVGDTNYMTTIASTKVMPQLLEESWKELRKAISKMKNEK
jgi:Diadenosine tetraphosphate (Ap4A) hydrolase and other HIT family hydrolases